MWWFIAILAGFLGQVISSVIVVVESTTWSHAQDACNSSWAVMIIFMAYIHVMYSLGLSVYYLENRRTRPFGSSAMILYMCISIFALLTEMTLFIADVNVSPCDPTQLVKCIHANIAAFILMFVSFGGVIYRDKYQFSNDELAWLI